jgi:hypothetical protein
VQRFVSWPSRSLRLAPYTSLAFTLVACGPQPLGPGGLADSGVGGIGLSSAGDSGHGASAGSDGGAGGGDISAIGGSAANIMPDAASDGGVTPYHALAAVTGQLHACALLNDHSVKCWGQNGYGQLGYGDTRDRGSAPADMGSALPTVDLGTGHTATKIAAGAYNTCAILDDSTLKCWGLSPLNGQPSKDAIGVAPGEMGDNLPPLNFGGRKVLNVGFGSRAACASLDDNTIWCWTDTTGIPQMVQIGQGFVSA